MSATPKERPGTLGCHETPVIRRRTSVCTGWKPVSQGFQLPFGGLAEETAGIVVEDFGGFCFAVAAGAEFEAGVGEVGGAGLAPVAGAVDADHLRAEMLEDVDGSLRGDFGDRVNREPGPEAVVARDADRVFLAMVD